VFEDPRRQFDVRPLAIELEHTIFPGPECLHHNDTQAQNQPDAVHNG
jgi:hypothetical protein